MYDLQRVLQGAFRGAAFGYALGIAGFFFVLLMSALGDFGYFVLMVCWAVVLLAIPAALVWCFVRWVMDVTGS